MELLKEICETPGVPGFEDRVQKIVSRELAKCCDEVRGDRVGNVIGLKKPSPGGGPSAEGQPPAGGKRPIRVMFAAHVDEIGFMVNHIDKDGFLNFIPIGGFDARLLLARRVLIHGKEEVRGIIAPQPPWLQKDDDKKKAPKIEDMIIDLAMPGEEVKKLVSVGDTVTLDTDFRKLNDNVVTGRNFDDRIGVYCMLEAMKRVRENRAEVYAVGTVQEEVGLRGAWPAAHAIAPDVGIAIDGSLASDIPYASGKNRHCSLGEGTGIYVIDKLTIGHPVLVRFLIELAEKHEIKFQRNIGGGTDASAMQKGGSGAMCTTIGAPTRYMHSTVQLCHLDDIEQTIELLKTFAEHAHEMAVPG